jgi:hypothetical protein
MSEKLAAETIYSLLAAEWEKTGWPKFYQRDLTFHDKNYLHETGTQEFIWVTRECGTHIDALDTDILVKKEEHNWPSCMVRCYRKMGSENRYYYFTEGILTEVTADQAQTVAELAGGRAREAKHKARLAAPTYDYSERWY